MRCKYKLVYDINQIFFKKFYREQENIFPLIVRKEIATFAVVVNFRSPLYAGIRHPGQNPKNR